MSDICRHGTALDMGPCPECDNPKMQLMNRKEVIAPGTDGAVVSAKSRWTPVLDGAVYCSPACGFKCTKEDHDSALATAEKIAKQLGPQWKPEVWENMRWHGKVVRVVAGIDFTVRANGTYYLASINNGYYNGTSESAREAVRLAVEQCEKAIEREQERLGRLNELLAEVKT